ncbi:D-amino-acid dehydrogenase [Amycolatopsis marina]|uniref:D-amino-acid dehydrogenase n=1 Tax=Amycolatopsis marina TaxID=490629 RepID=A0A1I0WK46_9PSEU|nr:FAD-dependent oxidoreductase [Amycolatopsis marina]SFA88598.1 D-amino-acid dehydrogenase [Amycolatopsis marina]
MRVIVIGSGIAGASAAYHLARAGVEVVIVDAVHPGRATDAGAGIVSPWTSRGLDGALYDLAERAAVHYRDLVGQLEEDSGQGCSFEIAGGMVVSADADELAEAQQRIAARARLSPYAGTVRRLDPGEARELFPPLAPGLGAVHITGAGRVDGRVLRRALLGAAAGHGAVFHEGVAHLREAGGRVGGVEVAGRSLGADGVVVAAGAWSPALVAPLGVRLAMSPQRGQISHFAVPDVDTAAWPVVLPVSSHYMLAFPGSRVVAGATRETGAGFDHRITAAGQREVLEHALTVAPGLAEATLLETRVGFRPLSADGAPLLGPLDSHPEVYVVSGFGPSGLTLGPYAGLLAATELTGTAAPLDLGPLRPERITSR